MSLSTYILPLTDIQTRAWVLDQWSESSALNVTSCAFAVSGALDLEAMRRAWNLVVARHPILSSTFELHGDAPVMRRGSVVPPAMRTLDLRDGSGKEADCGHLIDLEVRRRFDLEVESPIRFSVFRTADLRHTVLLIAHQIVCDRRSLTTICEQIATTYRALRMGTEMAGVTPFDLPLPTSTPSRVADDLSSWTEALAGASTPLALPSDWPPSVRSTFETATCEFPLSSNLVASLESLAVSTATSPELILRSAFAALLSRLSGETDFLMGQPDDLRDVALPDAVGPLTDIAVIRVDCSGNPRFTDFLERQQRAERERLSRPRVSFRRLVDVVDRTPQAGRSPLVQHLFEAASDVGEPSLRLDDVSVGRGPSVGGASMFDLALRVDTNPMGGAARWTFRSDLFAADTVARYAGCYERLLVGVAEDPSLDLARLPLLSESQRTKILVSWNETDLPRSPEETTVDLVERRAKHCPNDAAVIDGTVTLTYRDLQHRANQLAHHLRRLGVRRGARVAVSLNRSTDLITGLLAILKSGAAYIPLDPTYPGERIAYMMANAEASVLVTHGSLVEKLPPVACAIVRLDDDAAVIGNEPTGDLVDERAGSDDLGYVIYTSGSTGRPKGVAMPHRALHNLICWQLEQSASPHNASTLQYTPVSFDVSFQEIFSTLSGGGTLVVISDPDRRDPERLLARLEEHAVNRLFLPFVALQQFCETAQRLDRVPSALREVITAGEQLQITPAIRWFFERADNAVLENQYGPSETHVVTAYRLPGRPATWADLPSIGRPIANTQVFVVDEQMQPTPVGVPGELLIAGTPLAHGYLNAPEMTATRFLRHPFVAAADARVYRTGDLVRYGADGSIEFLGRRDTQVKLRGFRIELGEIESTLAQDPDVRESAVVLREDRPGEKRVVAYVVSDNSTLSIPRLRARLTDRLPDYMIPGVFVVLPRLPLTPSGKVDRRALPMPAAERPDLDRAFVAPRTAVEQRVASVWEAVLGIRPIGVNDSVFDLGAQSLQIVRAHPLLREVLGADLAVAELFELRTVAQLSRRAEQAAASTPVPTSEQDRARKQRQALANMARTRPQPVRLR